jgi:hypothetical protein
VDRGEARLPLAIRGTSVTVSRAASLTGIPLAAGTLHAALPADAADGYELRLAPGEVVAGSVVDETGRPLPGAHLSVVRPRQADDPFADMHRDEEGSGASGADGTFEIRGLDAIAYDFVVDVPEDFEPPAGLAVRGGQKDVRVTAVRGMRPVVVVLDGNERPIAGAEVTVTAGSSFFDPDSLTAETGADGRATLPALARDKKYKLDAHAPWGSDFQAFSAQWTAAAETVVHLARLSSIRGRVVDPDGEPARGIDVWWRSSGSKPGRRSWDDVRTDASGQFVIDGLEPGDFDLVAGDYGVKSGRGNGGWGWEIVDQPTEAAASASAVRTAAGATDVALRLAATDLVRVRLVGLPGPITVDEMPALGPTGNGGGRPAIATKDPAVVLFTGLASGRDYELWARFPRLGVIGHATVRGGTDGSVALEAGTPLQGRFAVADGATVRDLSVTYSIGDWRIEATATADGSFVIPCLPRVEGDVTAWMYGAGANWMGTIRGTPGTRVDSTLTRDR